MNDMSRINNETWVFDYSARSIISATQAEIISVLTDVPNLPSWNPAFSSVSTTADDGTYNVSVHGLLRGRLHYVVGREGVSMNITVPGLTESSSWEFLPTIDDSAGAHSTLVTHRVRQKGILTSMIGHREARQVPGKRLARLDELFQ